MGAQKTIVIKGHGTRYEAVASAAITPGHLVELASTGKVEVHNSAGANVEKAFAVEDDLQGRVIDTAYSANELVQYNVMKPGEAVNAILANGQNAAIGSFLESAGDGTLNVHSEDSGAVTIYTNQIVGVALEALDLSDSSGADPASARINVRII